MYLNKQVIACAGLSLFILAGCTTAKPALEGRLDANLGDAVRSNAQAHVVAPTPAQKANTYIPADPTRAALARKNYRENTVEEPIAINQKKSGD